MEEFSVNYRYKDNCRYNVFCKKCQAIIRISILYLTFKGTIYLDCKDNCKWTDIGSEIDYNLEPPDGWFITKIS